MQIQSYLFYVQPLWEKTTTTFPMQITAKLQGIPRLPRPKKNNIPLQLKMRGLIWKQFQWEFLLQFCYLQTFFWWDQYFGRSSALNISCEVTIFKRMWCGCLTNKSSSSCQILTKRTIMLGLVLNDRWFDVVSQSTICFA